jgi:hypothetical protein
MLELLLLCAAVLHDGLRLEKERAAGRVRQLQVHLQHLCTRNCTYPAKLLLLSAAVLQDGLRLEKERQRAAGRVQQLQAHLAAMRVEQEGIKRRLQERLVAQEKAAADKAKELAALRRAGQQLLFWFCTRSDGCSCCSVHTAQEKAAADEAKELPALRRAGGLDNVVAICGYTCIAP